MGKTYRSNEDGNGDFKIRLPKIKNRNPIAMTGHGSGGQVMKDRRDKRSKDHRRSWEHDYSENG